MGDFDDWYDTPVLVLAPAGTNEWGAKIPGTTSTVPCQVSQQVQLVRNADGQEVTSSASVQAALEWEATFEPGHVVIVHGRRTQVIGVAVYRGDPDLEGITVTLT